MVKFGKYQEINLKLFSEPNDSNLVDNCDNITVAPWGDLVLCEDGGGEQYLDVITPSGKIFKLAKNAKSSGEFAGATFSPDGSTLFVNMQHDGLTLAITGPWETKLG
jgi:secreted PhoX family phosphatase